MGAVIRFFRIDITDGKRTTGERHPEDIETTEGRPSETVVLPLWGRQ